MNLQSLFRDFNPSKFVIHSSLLAFTTLVALRLDGHIKWSYWVVFTPIWIWKALVLSGAAVGSYVWWRRPHCRLEAEAYVHYKAMLISLALHLILLMFELLVCDKMESGRHLWILVFVPLVFVSVVSVAVCIWAVKHDRSFELELFCAVNVLQFVFLALRLDGFIAWSWEVVFVPFWIVMCLSLVGVLYTVIFAGILLRTPEVSRQQRRASVRSAVGYTCLVLPLLVFQVLVANKLDGDVRWGYVGVCAPLQASFITLVLMSFSAKGGNKWWFGIRKEFSTFLLASCPLLQEYANISYRTRGGGDSGTGVSNGGDSEGKYGVIKRADLCGKAVMPIIAIDLPD